MDLNAAVAENIKKIRKLRKLSLERTASIAGVSRSMLGQIERGEANPSVAILEKLATALKIPAEELLRNDFFEPLSLSRELDHTPRRMDGGKVLVRDSMAYEEKTGMETAFLDVYISGKFVPDPDVSGCVCTATVISGTAWLQTGGKRWTLEERDALRFASDRPWEIENRGNAVSRLLLVRRYLEQS